ncbi:MAG: acetyl-CoA carboxylase carboxyltransferase subunit alpha [Candidatus Krumholzibacteriota bacterium]|nr:acetyl-CoA carboxylase carboxyltransferase subunit alpha [Candidatus Krumholzibacteriota bacterium]
MENQDNKILDFEKPVYEMQNRIEQLKREGSVNAGELGRLMEKLNELEGQVYKDLSAWERVQLARHPLRPTILDYIDAICDEFEELHGDRLFGDDPAVIAGIGRIDKLRLMIYGHAKGRNTQERIRHNFGMAKPEGFRKILRVMRMAEKFRLPVLSFIDTPGAYPGVGAEERGQPEAIAENLKQAFNIKTPILVIVIGEGGSGGALALAVGDRTFMMEHAIYSVISPEGCAAILWKSREKAPEAAASLRLTAADCLEFGVIDGILREVHGAAHRDPQGNAAMIKEKILDEVEALGRINPDSMLRQREEKFLAMGIFEED